jgi:hypothetical protein
MPAKPVPLKLDQPNLELIFSPRPASNPQVWNGLLIREWAIIMNVVGTLH